MGLCMFMSGKFTKLGSTHLVRLVRKYLNTDDDDQLLVSGFGVPKFRWINFHIFWIGRSPRTSYLLGKTSSFGLVLHVLVSNQTESHWDETSSVPKCIQLLEKGISIDRTFVCQPVKIGRPLSPLDMLYILWLNNLRAMKRHRWFLGFNGSPSANQSIKRPCTTCFVIIEGHPSFYSQISTKKHDMIVRNRSLLGGSCQLIRDLYPWF